MLKPKTKPAYPLILLFENIRPFGSVTVGGFFLDNIKFFFLRNQQSEYNVFSIG